MPRYYFNVHYLRPSIDDLGEELRGDQDAWKEATKITGELFRNIDGKFQPDQDWALEVKDEGGIPLYSIRITAQKMK